MYKLYIPTNSVYYNSFFGVRCCYVERNQHVLINLLFLFTCEV